MDENTINIGNDILVSTTDFQDLFSRDFPYLPVYVEGKAYFTNDIVYYEPNFYQSLVDNNTELPTNTTNWQVINDSVNNYIQDSDIMRAFNEAVINFNVNLFTDQNSAIMVFLYLAAHYLVIDLNNAMNPLALGFMGFTQSKSVGSVSESYGIPQWMLNNQALSAYAQTGYGRKYLSLIQPYLIGNVLFFNGRTTCG